MSGIAGPDSDAVTAALMQYADEHGGQMEPAEATGESFDFLIISESLPGRVSVMYPGEFMGWDDASAYLSRTLDAPVFSFHIHDDDLWMYTLFHRGEEIDHFNPIPAYWTDKISVAEIAKWKGDAAKIAALWPGIRAGQLANYLVAWDFDSGVSSKAYPDDRFAAGDSWQLTDFLRRLSLDYPIDDRGHPHGETYRFEVESADSR
jgi:hypothetical protein